MCRIALGRSIPSYAAFTSNVGLYLTGFLECRFQAEMKKKSQKCARITHAPFAFTIRTFTMLGAYGTLIVFKFISPGAFATGRLANPGHMRNASTPPRGWPRLAYAGLGALASGGSGAAFPGRGSLQ
jgi:hypothetical protein